MASFPATEGGDFLLGVPFRPFFSFFIFLGVKFSTETCGNSLGSSVETFLEDPDGETGGGLVLDLRAFLGEVLPFLAFFFFELPSESLDVLLTGVQAAI